MAIPIEGTTVVVRNEAIERAFAGGLDGFQTIVPNATYCADESIARVGFMNEIDAEQFAGELSRHHELATPGDFVIVRPFLPLAEQDLPWLSFGTWDQATIAWLEGTEPTSVFAPEGWDPSRKPLTHYSEDEVAENLEYLRSDDGVEVYLDKRTGQEVYSARTRPRAVRLFEEAIELARPHIDLQDRPRREEEDEEKGELALHRAIEMLEQAVELIPGYWNAWWYLGKCWQALAEPEQALEAFRRSCEACGDENPNTWREYMFECLNAGRAEEGIRAAERAVTIQPDDDGLVSNQALAYLIAGRLEEARAAVNKARKMNRSDSVTKNLERIIKEVRRGKRKQPANLRELQGD